MARFLCAVVLVATAAGACSDSGNAGDTSSGSSTTVTAHSRGTLPFETTTKEAIAAHGSLVLPASTADFLSAQLENREQLDVTFTLAAADESAFVEGSKLELTDHKRVVTHSSPLWKLNPDADIRGGIDTVTDSDGNRLTRAVEVTDEGTDRVRVRMVFTTA